MEIELFEELLKTGEGMLCFPETIEELIDN